MATDTFSGVKDVDINDRGKFKYILLKISKNNEEKLIVRGYGRCEYHADILDEVEPDLKTLGFQVECLGGGRIHLTTQEKTILVYGYSQAFGMADHALSVNILKKRFPDYKVTFINDGY